MDLLRSALAAAVRDVVRGQADAEQSRLVASRPLERWVEIFQELGRLQSETERFALDRRQAVVAGLGALAAGAHCVMIGSLEGGAPMPDSPDRRQL